LRDIKDVSVGDLSKQVENKVLGLKALVTKIEDMKKYIEEVLSGELPLNSDIVHNLQDIFNLLPNLNYEEIIKKFSVKTNDFQHMTYVCSLIRSVISLHNLINNKIVCHKGLHELSKEKKEKAKEIKDKEEGNSSKKEAKN